MRPVLWVAVSLCLVAVSCAGPGVAPSSQPVGLAGYRVLRDVPLPGDTSRWDYQVYDPDTRRLYIAHLGASQIVVFDTGRNGVIRVIDGVEGVHGLALAPDLGRLFASATDRNQLVAFDTATFRRLGSVATQSYPDGIAYAATAGRLFVSNEQGSGDTVIDARTLQHLGDVQVGSDIGNSYYDPLSQLVYVAAGGEDQLVAIDARTAAVVTRRPLNGCSGAHGLQLDYGSRHRVFVACQGNARLVAVDPSGRIEADLPVDDSPDVLALDTGLHRLYVASESGQVAVFDVAQAVRKLGQGVAGPDAHSIAVDSRTHIAYLPLTSVGGHPVLRELIPRS